MNLRSDRLLLEIKRARRPFAILVALVAMTVAASWYLLHKQEVQWPWQDTVKYDVAFSDVKGVRPGQQQVRIAGVKVGLISDAKVKGDTAILTLSLEKKYAPLYRDARLRLRPVTPLQDMYVSVDSRGTKAAGELGKGQVLPLQRSEAPVDVAQVLNTFDEDTRTRLASLISDFGSGVDGNGPELRRGFAALAPFLHHVDRLTSVMSERRTEIRRIVDNLGGLATAVNTRDRQLTQLVRSGQESVAELAAHDQSLAGTLGELPGTLSAIRTSFAALRGAQTQLDPALQALKPVAARLEKGLGGLEDLSKDATPSLKALRPAVKAARPLAKSLQPTSVAARDAFAKLAPTTPNLDRATKDIVPCELIAGKFFNWTLSVLKFYDSRGTWPRGEMSFGVPSLTLGQVGDPVLRREPGCTDKTEASR
ncbi:MlaD family protein [Patulibacter brassicae]|jgi:virulence factor Mce-like protein|uniref:MlaD family protein n=1 Tax=Patulibacter brassicae TaxID=1705717 RepID=A0ABU4VIR2_9ACTN|nr:MlaD family protein [Patulibacter brassicae]MDX8150710.1 MlaD family protein [Patulibacter brassicae]